MVWVSPTGFSDPDNTWVNETNAYDENIDTAAYDDLIPAASWGGFLHLTLTNPIECDKIRFNAFFDISANPNPPAMLWIDVYKDGRWINIFKSVYAHREWVEVEFAWGHVSEARLRFWNGVNSQRHGYLYEFDFWESTKNWVSPTSHTDVDNTWVNETNCYDDNEETNGMDDFIPPSSWGGFLELILSSAIYSHTLHFFANFDSYGANKIDIDVELNGAWTHVFEGSFTDKEYVEKTFDLGSVAKARIRFYNSHATAQRHGVLWEFDFLQVSAYEISGVIRDSAGDPLGNCVVWLFKTSDKSLVAETTSDVNGNYSFLVDNQEQHFIRAYKDGTPNVFGTTDRNLVGS